MTSFAASHLVDQSPTRFPRCTLHVYRSGVPGVLTPGAVATCVYDTVVQLDARDASYDTATGVLILQPGTYAITAKAVATSSGPVLGLVSIGIGDESDIALGTSYVDGSALAAVELSCDALVSVNDPSTQTFRTRLFNEQVGGTLALSGTTHQFSFMHVVRLT